MFLTTLLTYRSSTCSGSILTSLHEDDALEAVNRGRNHQRQIIHSAVQAVVRQSRLHHPPCPIRVNVTVQEASREAIPRCLQRCSEPVTSRDGMDVENLCVHVVHPLRLLSFQTV